MWAYNSSNFTNDYIFWLNKNNMIHAWCNYRVIMQWREITLKLYITLYSKSLNPTLNISPPGLAQSGRVRLDPKVAGSSPVWTTIFSSNNVRLLASWSLQVKTNSQNDWSVTNQIGYTGLRQDSYLTLFVGCFYRKGPALLVQQAKREHFIFWLYFYDNNDY